MSLGCYSKNCANSCFSGNKQDCRVKNLKIALTGNANVGKSVIFNQLTGLCQKVGNWPGKTIRKAQGSFLYKDYYIDLIDLPGIYSLTAYSEEEEITSQYIFTEKFDFMINVLDAAALERNLIFTLQLIEFGQPMVVVLNQMDIAKERKISIDIKKLAKILGVPVQPTIATHGNGLAKAIEKGIENGENKPKVLKYGREVEDCILKIVDSFSARVKEKGTLQRWMAIKLLEKDQKITERIKKESPQSTEIIGECIRRLEKIHGHDSFMVIAGERYHLTLKLVKQTVKHGQEKEKKLIENFDAWATHPVLGYLILAGVLSLFFLGVFGIGGWFSGLIAGFFDQIEFGYQALLGTGLVAELGLAVIESLFALIEVILPFIIPFYFALYFLENTGYLARIAFLMDNFMHKIGLHGKASFPIILGFGCNTSGCLASRIMETERERFIAGFLSTLVPCSAVTIIILGLTGRYLGLAWVLGLYLLTLIVVVAIGFAASKIISGKPTELLMMMPDYKKPHLKTVVKQTWSSAKEFIYLAAPLIILSALIIKGMYLFGWLGTFSDWLAPVTQDWLGLPKEIGILLVFGILRKELILVMMAALLGTSDFGLVLSPIQMIVLSLVSIFYIPCVATMAALWKEFGIKRAAAVIVFEIGFAILLGGLAYRVLSFVF